METVSSDRRRLYVYIISDATGITAERVINAVLVQFKQGVDPVFERYPFVENADEIHEALDRAEEKGGILIYSLASDALRKAIQEQKREHSVMAIDLLGPLLKQVGTLINLAPALRPGLMERFGDHSLRLAGSIDFTLKHDDGQNLDTIDQADLLILGVSRTSKTPTSLYLSCNHNLKVANVPIVMGIEPPPQIFNVACRRIGFHISAARLAFLRSQRFTDEALHEYTDRNTIREELHFCQQVYQRIPGLQTVDVTNVSIEEVANRIM